MRGQTYLVFDLVYRLLVFSKGTPSSDIYFDLPSNITSNR